MSVVKKWLQKHQIYIRDLHTLLPQYGVNDPDKELSGLRAKQWVEIQDKIKRAHRSDKAAVLANVNKKLLKFSKLWRAEKKKNKKTGKSTKSSRSPQSVPLPPAASPLILSRGTTEPTSLQLTPQAQPQGAAATSSPSRVRWDDSVEGSRVSDVDDDALLNRNGFVLAERAHHESVVDLLMTVDHIMPGSPGRPEREESKYSYTDGEEPSPHSLSPRWVDHDQHLTFSDEEQPDTLTPHSATFALKPPQRTQSVVDLLLEGPLVMESPLSSPLKSLAREERENYSESLDTICSPKHDEWLDMSEQLRISDDDDNAATDTNDQQRSPIKFVPSAVRRGQSVVDMLAEGPPQVTVSLEAESVSFDERNGVYTVSLRDCKLLSCDAMTGTVSIVVAEDKVNTTASRGIRKESNDQFIGAVLDHILDTQYSPE